MWQSKDVIFCRTKRVKKDDSSWALQKGLGILQGRNLEPLHGLAPSETYVIFEGTPARMAGWSKPPGSVAGQGATVAHVCFLYPWSTLSRARAPYLPGQGG